MGQMPADPIPSLGNLRTVSEEKRRKRKLRPNATAELMDKLAFELDNLPGGVLAPAADPAKALASHGKKAIMKRVTMQE